MAFEHKLEADRIDDFNFFSAFVRVPLLIIGGILGVDGSSSLSSSSSSALVPASASDETNNILKNENENDDNSNTTDNDCTATTTTTQINQRRQPSNSSSMGRPSQRNSSEYLPDCYNNDDNNNNNNNNNNHGMKRTKKTMSWSDESGLPLVAYDESASHHHDPYASSTVITSRKLKPTKSVIKQSRSSEGGTSSSCQEPSTNTLPLSSSASASASSSISSSRYIPNMNPRKGNNGLIVPTRPYGSHHHQSKCTENQSNTNGSEMSPQWGWYINTTPPTPELYHSRSSSKSSFSSGGGGGGNSGSIKPINKQLDTITSSSLLSYSPNSNTIVDGNTCQNQVFQNLKNSNAPIHGWTSIPI